MEAPLLKAEPLIKLVGPLHDREDACIWAANLAKHFSVPTPAVEWTQRLTGLYRGMNQEIVMGPRCSGLPTMVHEFAHHLRHERPARSDDYRKKYVYEYKGPWGSHDVRFADCLLDVVIAVYGSIGGGYPWASEYDRIQKYGLLEAKVLHEKRKRINYPARIKTPRQRHGYWAAITALTKLHQPE